jgi:hypothetical protein
MSNILLGSGVKVYRTKYNAGLTEEIKYEGTIVNVQNYKSDCVYFLILLNDGTFGMEHYSNCTLVQKSVKSEQIINKFQLMDLEEEKT